MQILFLFILEADKLYQSLWVFVASHVFQNLGHMM